MDALPQDWNRLFPDTDYRFQFGVSPCSPSGFFAPTQDGPEILAERKHWLADDPERYAGLLPEGEQVLREAVRLARAWDSIGGPLGDEPVGLESCIELGRRWEPDFVLLRAHGDGPFRMVGGCVCFPSSWRLLDKLGKPLDIIHGPVPGLNQSLGQSIGRFLHRLKAGEGQARANWGLSRSPELNQHLDRDLPRLDAPVKLAEVFLRIERQILVALPESDGILFGIRLEIINLGSIPPFSDQARSLARALRSMPEDVAAYKNLTATRDQLASELAGKDF